MISRKRSWDLVAYLFFYVAYLLFYTKSLRSSKTCSLFSGLWINQEPHLLSQIYDRINTVLRNSFSYHNHTLEVLSSITGERTCRVLYSIGRKIDNDIGSFSLDFLHSISLPTHYMLTMLVDFSNKWCYDRISTCSLKQWCILVTYRWISFWVFNFLYNFYGVELFGRI